MSVMVRMTRLFELLIFALVLVWVCLKRLLSVRFLDFVFCGRPGDAKYVVVVVPITGTHGVEICKVRLSCVEGVRERRRANTFKPCLRESPTCPEAARSFQTS